MIETYIDFARSLDLRMATTLSNEQIKTNENAGWMMIQCQLMEVKDAEGDLSYTYTLVYQRTKEQVVGNYGKKSDTTTEIS